MKKLLVFILVLVLSLSLVSVSFSVDMFMRFSSFGPVEDGLGEVFKGDYFSLDLYFTNDLTAYLVQTVWYGDDPVSSVKYAAIKSKEGDSKTLYFVFADGSYITGHYDEEQSWKFWLDFDGGSLRLVMGDEWLPSDFVKE